MGVNPGIGPWWWRERGKWASKGEIQLAAAPSWIEGVAWPESATKHRKPLARERRMKMAPVWKLIPG